MSLLKRAMERIRPRFDRERIDSMMPIMPPSPRGPMPLPLVPLPSQPPVDPRIIPPRPPSIGGIGGINQDFRPIQPVLRQPQPIPQVPQPLEKMPLPPKRDDFMSIGGPGGGFTDNRTFSPVDRTNILPPLDSIQPPPLPEDRYGTGKMFDPANLPEGYSFQDTIGRVRTAVAPRPGFVYAYGPDGDRIEVPSGEPGAEELRNRPPLSTILGDLSTRQPTTPAPTTPVQDPIGTPNIIDPTITPTPVPEPVTTPAPVTPPEPVTPPASTTVAANQPTETTAPANVSNQNPFASSVRQVASGLDPLTEQLLFGVGGQGGFIPGAMRAAERTFYDEESIRS